MRPSSFPGRWWFYVILQTIYGTETFLVPQLTFMIAGQRQTSAIMMLNVENFHFFKDSIYLFLERGEGREKEGEWNINVWLLVVHPSLGTWPATQACALTGIRTSNAFVYRPALNPLSYTSQGENFQFWIQEFTFLLVPSMRVSTT